MYYAIIKKINIFPIVTYKRWTLRPILCLLQWIGWRDKYYFCIFVRNYPCELVFASIYSSADIRCASILHYPCSTKTFQFPFHNRWYRSVLLALGRFYWTSSTEQFWRLDTLLNWNFAKIEINNHLVKSTLLLPSQSQQSQVGRISFIRHSFV